MNDEYDELLDVIEFCEGALFDYLGRGLDIESARRIAQQCSDVLVTNGRTSLLGESSKQPLI